MSINLYPNDIYYSKDSFDLSFIASNAGTEITDFTGYKFVINDSNSISVLDCDYSPNTHRFTKIQDNYHHVLLPLTTIGYKYVCIQISNSDEAYKKYNGYYYYDDTSTDAWSNARNAYNSQSTSLILKHTNGQYQLRAEIIGYSTSFFTGTGYVLRLWDNGMSTNIFTICFSQQEYEQSWQRNVEWLNSATFQFGKLVEGDDYNQYQDIVNFTGTLKKDVLLVIDNQDYSINIQLKNNLISSDIISKKLIIKKQSPINTYLQLVGSTEDVEYTGFYQKYERFFPSAFITAEYSAMDIANMGVSIFINSNSISQGIELESGETKVAQLLLPQMNIGGIAIKNVVKIKFTDVAGNVSEIEKSIVQNNVLSRFSNDNLVKSAEKIIDKDGILIVQTTISDADTYYRAWNEYWFPDTHKLPTLSNGMIDEQRALAMMLTPSWSDEWAKSFDKAKSNSGLLLKDSEGRVLQEWTDNKKYGNDINDWELGNNAEISSYRIINPQDISDFRLQFEYFNLDTAINIGYNRTAYNLGYKGDVLVIYDASAEGCTKKKNNNGITEYVLEDPSKLKRLFAIKGSVADNSITIKDFTADESSNSWEKFDNGLITPAINSDLICLIPYTDRGSVSTGFKLKAGPKIQYEYNNYDINYETGEIWVHSKRNDYISPEIKASYNYYQNSIDEDNENGTIILSNTSNSLPLVGNVYVYLNMSKTEWQMPFRYLNGDEIKTFITTQDDFQDYSTPFFYCSPDEDYLSNNTKRQSYDEMALNPRGRISKFSINKDEGYLHFSRTGEVVPKGRIFGSYYIPSYFGWLWRFAIL